MAGRRRKEGLEVSLFPFLSVLACVIGTLTLILASMAVSHVGGSSLQGVRLGDEIERAQTALLEARVELDALEDHLATLESSDADQTEVQARLMGLGLSPEITLDELEALVDEHRRSAESAKIEARRDRLQAKRMALEKRVQGLQADVDVRVDARSELSMRIAPAGVGPAYRPYFAECTEGYVEVHTTRSDFSYRVPREDVLRGQDFQRFLRRIRVIRGVKLVFLIRPEGVETFQLASKAATRLEVPFAKLPLPGDGQLDFSLFDVPDSELGTEPPR